MKRFAAVTLAVLMLLTVFASAASAQDAIEIRGPVFNGSNIQEIVGTDGITIDATQFAAFFYDINDNVTTETLSIINVPGNNGNVIGEWASMRPKFSRLNIPTPQAGTITVYWLLCREASH